MTDPGPNPPRCPRLQFAPRNGMAITREKSSPTETTCRGPPTEDLWSAVELHPRREIAQQSRPPAHSSDPRHEPRVVAMLPDHLHALIEDDHEEIARRHGEGSRDGARRAEATGEGARGTGGLKGEPAHSLVLYSAGASRR
jgi:hypothetical protein